MPQMTTANYNADCYYLDRMALELSTVAELDYTLKIASIQGRSRAKTKAQKVDLLLRCHLGYTVNEDGTVSRPSEGSKK